MTASVPQRLVWATRGRTWGFRFLRDGGEVDPLPVYERAFAGAGNETTIWLPRGDLAALRFPDPLGRTDRAGRTIPHEFVVYRPLRDAIDSVDDGRRLVWPLVADEFRDLWELDRT